MSHLDALEAEAIHIMREVVAEAENPVMLYSIGKDSSVMLHLARKAFHPGKIPFPIMHIDTMWKFSEMIEFRDKTAKELGMTRSTFQNPHGLTERGHLSTARDISTIMQALDNDFADFMHIFSRVNTKLSTRRNIQHSGHRLIKDYKEATAVKTGHTRAAGFNGAMIAEKRSDKIIVVVFGGKSTQTRNTQMIKLADLGFTKLSEK